MWHLTKIPKIIHFYWGNEKLSYLRYLSVYSFRKLNLDWQIKIHVPAVLSTDLPAWNTMHQKNIKIDKDYFDRLEELDVEKNSLKTKIDLIQTKIDWLIETGNFEFDEEQYKVYTTIKLLEKKDLSILEKSKLIAELIKNS